MSDTNGSEYVGRCFCGEVEVHVKGAPAAAGYCHCESCRQWSASPINAFTLWPTDAVVVSKGEDALGVYNKTDKSYRKWCKRCGGHVFTDHPEWGLVDVYAGILEGFPFEPGVHVNYQEKVLAVHDGLPKQQDLPSEMGGSGALLPE